MFYFINVVVFGLEPKLALLGSPPYKGVALTD